MIVEWCVVVVRGGGDDDDGDDDDDDDDDCSNTHIADPAVPGTCTNHTVNFLPIPTHNPLTKPTTTPNPIKPLPPPPSPLTPSIATLCAVLRQYPHTLFCSVPSLPTASFDSCDVWEGQRP